MQAVAQETIELTGSWVGVYALGDQTHNFFIEWDAGENGRFQLHQSPRSTPIRQINQDNNHIEFTIDMEETLFSFRGDWAQGAYGGSVENTEENGRFYLTPLAPINTVTFDTTSGSYDMETEAPILINRADTITQLFYQQGDQQIRIYPIKDNQYLTALGDQLILKADQIHLKPVLSPEQASTRMGVRTNAYTVESTQFENGDVALSGNIFIPRGEGSFPAVILLHGAGASEHHYYQIFADLFARNGIATLVYDKRGFGESTGHAKAATLQDLADDAHAGIQYLTQHDKIDMDKIGVWGFSQGGRILPMVLAQNDAVAFAIGISAPAMSTYALHLWQQDQQLQETSISELARFFRLKVNQLQQELPWQETHEDNTMQPTTYWQQVQQPTLLIYGNEDKIVPPDDSAKIILNTLNEAGNTAVSLSLFATANHDILLIETAVPTYASGYFDTMISWIKDGYPAQFMTPNLQATGEFTENGRYAPTPWYGQTWFILLVVFCGGMLFITGVRISVHFRQKQSATRH